jgi:hypothetical protein
VSAPIFISYSSKDQDIAETIYQALEARGQPCWIACRDVMPGENYQEAIVRALRSAKVMLLVFTSNANNSDEIKKELVLAGRHRVTVVPVRVEDVVPNDAFSYEFATRQWVDLFKDWEREIEQLSTQLGHVLANAKPQDGAAATAAPAAKLPPRAQPLVKPKPSNPSAMIGAALAAMLIVAGAVLYLRPWAHTPVTAPPPLPQTTAQTPSPLQQPPASSPPPANATTSPPPQPAPSPPPAPVSAAQADPEDTAWRAADAAASIDAFRDYQKAFPGGAHEQAAQLRILDLMLLAPATAAKAFDGAWLTTWTCPPAGQALGYSFQFITQVKDGAIHGTHGTPGERGSMVIDGKVETGGDAAIFGKGVVGASAFAVGGQAAGTPFSFHGSAHFEKSTGTGKRIEGRICNVTFQKQ